MARDINNVTDDISLVMRELIDATENAIVLETAVQLHKGSKTNDPKEYVKKQNSNNKEFNNKINKVVKKSQDIMFNVVDNVGSYTGTETSNLKKEINKGMKMVVASAKNMKKDTIKSVSRLDRYRKSSQFMPDIDRSIIQRTKKGIEKGLPVRYKNGRKVSYKAYMEMAVRTGIQQEIGDRQLETGGQANIVFWLVNEFEDCADDHASYQGKVYYDERYKNFKLKDQAKDMIENYIRSNNLLSIQEVRDKPPYLTTRPNCRHKMKPVGIDQVMNQSVENLKEELGYRSRSYRPQNYEATKTQRYNERQIRGYKQKEQTFRKLYNTTKNKDYLIEAQKAKRQTLFWQKRQRQHIENNPQLFRDYERETSKVLLQDLGLGKKIKVDPTKPPTPIINNPPQTPPKKDVPINETIKEHLEIPEEKETYLDIFPKHEYIMPNAFKSKRGGEKNFNTWKNEISKLEIAYPRVNKVLSKANKLFYEDMELVQGTQQDYHISYNRYRAVLKVPNLTTKDGRNRTKTFTHEYAHMIDLMVGRDITRRYPRKVVGRIYRNIVETNEGVNSLTSEFYEEQKGLLDNLKENNPNLPPEVEKVFETSKQLTKGVKEWRDRNGFSKDNKYDAKIPYSKLPDAFKKIVEEANEARDQYREEIEKPLQAKAKEKYDKALLELRNGDMMNRFEFYKRWKALEKAHKKEWKEAYNKGESQYRGDYGDATALHDIFDAHTSGRGRSQKIVKYGHGVPYYNDERKDDGVNTEIFANLSHLSVHNKEYYEIARETFPETVEAYEAHIKSLEKYIENILEGEQK